MCYAVIEDYDKRWMVMSKRYSSDFKRLVLRLLHLNKGNVIEVAHFADIPERTLRDWQRNERESVARRRAAAVPTASATQRRIPPV